MGWVTNINTVAYGVSKSMNKRFSEVNKKIQRSWKCTGDFIFDLRALDDARASLDHQWALVNDAWVPHHVSLIIQTTFRHSSGCILWWFRLQRAFCAFDCFDCVVPLLLVTFFKSTLDIYSKWELKDLVHVWYYVLCHSNNKILIVSYNLHFFLFVTTNHPVDFCYFEQGIVYSNTYVSCLIRKNIINCDVFF